MPTPLSTYVSVTVTTASRSISQRGFGIPLVMAYHTVWGGNEVREYTSPQAMLDDGFQTSGAQALPYLIAASAWANDPSIERVLVGRRAAGQNHTGTLTFTPQAEGYIHRATISTSDDTDAHEWTYTEGSSDTGAIIAADFTSSLNTDTAVTSTATDNLDGTVQLDPDGATAMLGLSGLTNSVTWNDDTADAGIATDLGNALAENGDWYALFTDSCGAAEVAAAASWAETNKKLYFAQFGDSDVLSATASNIAETLQTAAYNYTVPIWQQNPLEFAGAAYGGWGLPIVPGGQTWQFAGVPGLPSSTQLTATQQTNLRNQNCNFNTTAAGANIIDGGKCASGQFIDVRRTIDKLQARIEESVFLALINPRKIPYTDVGFQLIRAAIEAPIIAMERDGAFAPGSTTVTAPKKADQLQADVTARIARGFTATTTLAGAVHTVTVSVSAAA
jgi:hypothetical protein